MGWKAKRALGAVKKYHPLGKLARFGKKLLGGGSGSDRSEAAESMIVKPTKRQGGSGMVNFNTETWS